MIAMNKSLGIRRLCLLGGWILTGLTLAAQVVPQGLARWVDPFIGTGGHGHTFPGAVVPNGMVQPSPDTRIHGWDACSGYHYSDTHINGFAQTHLSGTGGSDFGDFLLMPVAGDPDLRYSGEKDSVQQVAYASAFSHEREWASPGYYGVMLDRYGVKAEMTATTRTALFRFSFPKGCKKRCLVLDLDYNIQEQTNFKMEASLSDSVTLTAFKSSQWWAYRQDIHLAMQCSEPIAAMHLVRDTLTVGQRREPRCKAVLTFAPSATDEPLMVKTSVSACDADGALRNLLTEQPAFDFEGTRRRAENRWNECLARIDIRTNDEAVRRQFYTALYHAHIAPATFCDVDGRYLGNDLKVHQGRKGETMYTYFSLWDTFRALHPLLSIIAPEQNEAYIRALVQKGRDGGLVPKWDCAANYTGCMIGYHLASLVADSYVKGHRHFAVRDAYEACLRLAEYDTTGIAPAVPRWLYPYIMPEARRWKAELGFIPADREKESVAKALEYAYDDWCISQLAVALGDTARASRYGGYAQAYRTYFDPSTRMMRGRLGNGTWRTPFSATRSDHRNDDYCEGNAWQWSWFVPHDVDGLVALHGGPKRFAADLDALFAAPSEVEGENVSADITGLIGQYAHGNEPSHHIIHLYNYVGRPRRTQELADRVLRTLYAAAPDGLAGNEDCGQMSAWYVLNAMGFYQVCPGRPVYSIGRPLLDEAVIHLPNGRTFTIRARHNAANRCHVRSMRLNGQRLARPFFTHEQLERGGVLELDMTR